MHTAPDLAFPQRCTVLVVGGGPAGAFAASVLARESIDVVLLESDVFPRYHIGETMLPAMRHLLCFVDADSKFANHGFVPKTGSAFKLNKDKREGYFLAVGGPDNFTWNLVRSESDQILFEHAKECGATVFDGVKVTSISFDKDGDPSNARPIRASFMRRSDSTRGEISFDYLVDASGRAGLLSTKYLKNRNYNNALKNVATWAYWKDAGKYALGTSRENTPLSEALTGKYIYESGWAWYIPLHTGHSVGVVLDQASFSKKKLLKSHHSSAEFYLEQLKLAPMISSLLEQGSMITDSNGDVSIKTASDYSYSADTYSAPNLRIAGDAGAFIDPYFSSGVHLAMMGGMSAAISICASLRCDCSEEEASQWHSKRVAASYTWFLIVVLAAYKQIRAQEEPILSDVDEDNFDRAFAFMTPVIQGSVDVRDRVTNSERENTLNLCSKIFGSWHPTEREALLTKLRATGHILTSAQTQMHDDALLNNFASSLVSSDTLDGESIALSEGEKLTLENAQARKLIRIENTLNIANFVTDVIDKKIPRLERGALGLCYQ